MNIFIEFWSAETNGGGLHYQSRGNWILLDTSENTILITSNNPNGPECSGDSNYAKISDVNGRLAYITLEDSRLNWQ